MTNKKTATFLLGLSMFFTGASGLVNEYVLSTVSTYILGSSIEQFSITIAMMLGMMGIGSAVQKYINDKNLIAKFAYIEISLAIIGSFAPILIYSAFGHMENHFNLIYYTFVSLIGFLVGFEIPFIIRINEKYSSTLKANLSLVMSMDYIGSFVGAIIWVYYLLPSFNLNQISFIVSGTNLFVALITLAYFLKIKIIKFNFLKSLGILLVLFILIFGYTNVLKWENKLEQKLYQDPIVTSLTTKYQHLTLTHNKSLDELRLYINGNIQFSSLDEKRYHELMVHSVMSINKNPKDILILGGGDGLALREVKKYENINSITLIDLDPKMVQFSSTNKELVELNKNAFDDVKVTVLNNKLKSEDVKDIIKLDDKKKETKLASVNVINIDADLLLGKTKDKKYDVIIIDFPDPSSIELNKLYTKQFYYKIKRLLKKDSKLIVQSTSPYHGKEAFLCIGRTINKAGINVLPIHLNIPSFGDWGWWIGGLEDIKTTKLKIESVKDFKVNTDFLTSDILKSSLIFGKNELIAKNNEINTLMKPSLLYIYNKNSWLNY